MKIIVAGHQYQLKNFENDGFQILRFIHKEPIKPDSTEFKTIEQGTTNEEVLLCLLDRLNYQYNKLRSKETYEAITKIEEALLWLDKRTQDRKARNVEGTNQP